MPLGPLGSIAKNRQNTPRKGRQQKAAASDQGTKKAAQGDGPERLGGKLTGRLKACGSSSICRACG